VDGQSQRSRSDPRLNNRIMSKRRKSLDVTLNRHGEVPGGEKKVEGLRVPCASARFTGTLIKRKEGIVGLDGLKKERVRSS